MRMLNAKGLRIRADEERGAMSVEYALVLVLCALVIIAAAAAIGLAVAGLFQDASGGFPGGGS